MMVKLITVVYAWVWNVQPWQPASKEDWGMIIGVSSLLDPVAIAGLAIAVTAIIRNIRGRRAERSER